MVMWYMFSNLGGTRVLNDLSFGWSWLFLVYSSSWVSNAVHVCGYIVILKGILQTGGKLYGGILKKG